MSSGAARRLTDRQRAVLQRIDRRVPIKVIAQELGVSETRINQHIRALKNVYDAGSLGELVENYRATLAPETAAETPDTNLTLAWIQIRSTPSAKLHTQKIRLTRGLTSPN
jgi:DNA-binding NarL/FixJ family response regulator